MTTFTHALVRDGAVVLRSNEAPNVDQSTLAEGKPRWLPIEVEGETFDPVSEVREGPELLVEADRVLYRYTVRVKNADELAIMRSVKQAAIDLEFEARWQAPIEHTVGGVARSFHADQAAVDNVSGIVLLIVSGVPVPNPRPWTPVGSFTPVDITHAELIGLGAAIAARKDALFVKKKAAQAAVEALTDPAEIEAFDAAGCWA